MTPKQIKHLRDLNGSMFICPFERDKTQAMCRQVSKAICNLEVAIAALHSIAAWSDGEEVTAVFDSPGDAFQARAALHKMGIKRPA